MENCRVCGIRAESYQFVCLKCGAKLKKSYEIFLPSKKILPSNPPKKPMVAAVLAFLLTGLGQVYLGQVHKGIALFIAGTIIGAITFGIACPVMFVISTVDAYKIAKKLEAGNSVGPWEFF